MPWRASWMSPVGGSSVDSRLARPRRIPSRTADRLLGSRAMRQGGEGITIGIVAGEASGDALGGELIGAVRARLPAVRFAGIAGPRMEAAGCEAWYPFSRLGLRGYAEVAMKLPGLVMLRRELRTRLLAAKAALFIGIDAPDFNLGLEGALKRAGVRTIQYVSPSVWAWRRERIDT